MKLRIYYLAVLSLFIVMSFNITTNAQPVLDTPANNTLNYPFAKVTYTWDTVGNAASYDLQVFNDTTAGATYQKTYSNITTNSYTPSTDYLNYNTQYFWRVRPRIGTVYAGYSDYYTFTTGTPSNSIGVDPNANITFDHTTGRVTQIIFKNGSNNPILNTGLNDKNKMGFGRIDNETGTKLSSWSESPGSFIYNYDNAAYGSKTLTIAWSANGITIDIAIDLAAGKLAILNAAWQPGGDIGPLHDYVLYAANATQLTKTNLQYPGFASILYSGNTILTAMTDDRYPEYFGFKSSTPVQTVIQQGVAFGPTFTYSTSTSLQTLDLTFAVMSKTKFFNWCNGQYVIVSAPPAGASLLDQSSPTVNWETFGLAGNINISLSTDGGTTFDTVMAGGITDNGSKVVTLPYLSASVPLSNCLVKVSGVGASGSSGIFSIVSNASSVFSVPSTLTGAPTDTVTVPVLISPALGSSIYAFDVRVMYDKSILTYSKSITDTSLNNWSVNVTGNSGGYVQIGGFNNSGAPITSNDTLVTLKFAIKSTAIVGAQTPLTINNSYLSAANSLAQTLLVSGVDGLVTLYSRTSGFLRYIVSKKPITGTTVIAFVDTAASVTTFGSTDASGFFDFSNKTPGSVIKLAPISSLSYPASITDAVNAADAAKVFAGRDGGPTPLTALQDVVADINGDGKINSTDAYAILKISTGALTAASFGQSNWVFIDSSYAITTTNWASAPQNKFYAPLDSVNSRQSFWGAIRGDVDGGYSLPSSLNKSSTIIRNMGNTGAVVFSVPGNINVRPGDTLCLPLNAKLNGQSIGSFNTSLQLDAKLISYCGIYTESSSLPSNKGWNISAYYDSNGKFNIGAADFSDTLSPISADGTIAIFKFIVNNKASIGDTIPVIFSGFFVTDAKLDQLSVNGQNGKVTISSVSLTGNNNLIYEYTLAQNYPNPFNPSTTIEYSLKKQGNVQIEIYNVIGQRVTTLFNGAQPAGSYKLEWNAKGLASGVYFYRIRAGEFTQVKKMMLLK